MYIASRMDLTCAIPEKRLSSILLYGGSFDPIHNGHLIVCRYAAERIQADRAILIPSAAPPHKQQKLLAPADLRVELCRLAVRAEPGFEINDWETRQSGPNYTLHTVRHFRTTEPPETQIYWLIGQDSLLELPTWHRVRELASLCTIVTVGRPGSKWPSRETLLQFLSSEQADTLEAHFLDSPLIEITATDIRDRVRKGLSIRYLVPDAVADAIAARGLYRDSFSQT